MKQQDTKPRFFATVGSMAVPVAFTVCTMAGLPPNVLLAKSNGMCLVILSLMAVVLYAAAVRLIRVKRHFFVLIACLTLASLSILGFQQIGKSRSRIESPTQAESLMKRDTHLQRLMEEPPGSEKQRSVGNATPTPVLQAASGQKQPLDSVPMEGPGPTSIVLYLTFGLAAGIGLAAWWSAAVALFLALEWCIATSMKRRHRAR